MRQVKVCNFKVFFFFLQNSAFCLCLWFLSCDPSFSFFFVFNWKEKHFQRNIFRVLGFHTIILFKKRYSRLWTVSWMSLGRVPRTLPQCLDRPDWMIKIMWLDHGLDLQVEMKQLTFAAFDTWPCSTNKSLCMADDALLSHNSTRHLRQKASHNVGTYSNNIYIIQYTYVVFHWTALYFKNNGKHFMLLTQTKLWVYLQSVSMHQFCSAFPF